MKIVRCALRCALGLALVAVAVNLPLPAKSQGIAPADLFYSEVQTVYLINLERRQVGAPPLRWNQELTRSARTFAEDVISQQTSGYCGHIDSQGRAPGERIRLAGFTQIATWAENSVCGYTSPEAAVRAWMNSESHRKNLLDTRLREVGIGYALSSAYRGYIVADMATDPSYAPVIIDNEAPATTSTAVRLYIYNQVTRTGFTGQGESVAMMIANDPAFTGATWQPYAAEVDWTLASGDGWKTVYVKTRDALGRTVVVHDTIYLGAAMPLSELSFDGASQFGTGFRLQRIEAAGWPQVQFSMDWVGDDSDPNFTASGATRVGDALAVGGAAMRLPRGGTATIWTGGYLAARPGVAYFRAKVSDRSSQNALRVRVMGPSGDAGQVVLRGVDFAAADLYQEFAVPYNLGGAATSVVFRFDRLGDAEITVDAVTLYAAPIPVAAPLQWQAPENYLRSFGVQARFVKEDGAFSEAVDVHPASGALTIHDSPPGVAPQLAVTPPSVLIEANSTTPPPPAQVNVACTNCGAGPWQARTETAWLQLSASSSALALILLPDGLAPGVYQGEVTISAPAEAGVAPVVVSVTAVVGNIEALMDNKIFLPAVRRY